MFDLKFKHLFLLPLCMFFISCSSPTKPAYYWDRAYIDAVYGYLIEEYDEDSQILALEKIIKDSNQNNGKIPPGLYAHLGLLYSNKGNINQAIFYLNQEKAEFRESETYIKFLLDKYGKKGVTK